MTRPRLGLLALCTIVFAATAFGTSAAQAEVGSQWLLAKLTPEGVKLITFLSASVEFETDVPFIWHFSLIGHHVLFECSTIKAVNTKLLANGSIGEKEGAVKGSKIKYSGCKTKIDGSTSASCEPNAGGGSPGVIETNLIHYLIVLHELAGGTKDELVLALPDTGETYAMVEMGEVCALGEELPLIGKHYYKDCENAFLKHLLKHLWETAPLTELWFVSKTEEHKATFLGSWWVFLIFEHKGLHFSGDPA